MIYIRKARKKNLDLLIKCKLETIIPYIEDNNEKLKVLAYVNEFMSNNYDKAYLVYANFKFIGSYLINNNYLDMLYIENKFRNLDYGSKILKKIYRDIEYIWVMKENKEAINFYKKWNFIKVEEEKNRYLLKRS